MSGYARSMASVLVLALPLVAWGNGFSSHTRSMAVAYYPAPACVPIMVPCVVAPAPVPCLPLMQRPATDRNPPALPSGARSAFATPTAAPPSTQPPPLSEPSPATKPKEQPPAQATPLPAPPSLPEPTKPPPAIDKPPAVTEGSSYFDTYAVASHGAARPAGDRCSVGFWNLTDRDLTIKVDGQAHVVAHGKSLPLDVARQFVWQIEGRDPQKEQIATGESAIEIVIRR
jgi:hypothetical protein